MNRFNKIYKTILGAVIFLGGIATFINGVILLFDEYERNFNVNSIIYSFIFGIFMIMMGIGIFKLDEDNIKNKNTKEILKAKNNFKNMNMDNFKEKNTFEDKFKDSSDFKNNIKIWVCPAQNSSEKEKNAKKIMQVVVFIVLMILLLIYTATVVPYFNMDIIIEISLIVIGAFILSFITLRIFLYSRKYEITFALDNTLKMYMFDHTSKAFKKYEQEVAKSVQNRDRESLIKELINKREIYPFGKEIKRIKKVEKRKYYYKIECALVDKNGTEKIKKITAIKKYKDFKDLIQEIMKRCD